jgi:hypothetical protein
MRKLLKGLWIVQERKFKNVLNKTYKKHRFNPYNPLSYITILIFLLVGIIMFGFVGVWREIESGNPFKWK